MKNIKNQLQKIFLKNISEEQTLFKNSFWLAISRFGGSILRAILIIYSFRVLGPDLQGSFITAMSFIMIFSFIPDFGLTAIVIREISKNYDNKSKILANAIVAVTFLLILSIILILLSKNIFIKNNLAQKIINLLILFLIFDVLREFLYALFRTYEKMELQAASHLLTNFILLTTGIIILSLYRSPILLSYAYIIGSIVGFLFNIIILLKDLTIKYSRYVNIKEIIALLNKSWPIGIANFLFLIITYIDILILGWFYPSKEVGLYSAVVKLVEVLYFFPAALGMSIFPIIAKKNHSQEITQTIHNGINYGILLSLPMFVGIFILADEIINLLYGIEYLPASLALKLITFAIPLNFLSLTLIEVLIALDKRKELLIYDIFIVLINFYLNVMLVPQFSYFASSFITSLCSFLSLVFAAFILKKYVYFSFKNINYKNYVLAAMLMGIIIYYLPSHLIFKIIIGALSYFGLLLLLKDELLLRILKHQ